MDRDALWARKYLKHRDSARFRGIPFLLTFKQWTEIWLASGKWDQRGNQRGKYCMARFGDQGAYEVGNVSITLIEINREERNRNYPLSGEKNTFFNNPVWLGRTRSAKDRAKKSVKAQSRSRDYQGRWYKTT
ncbi:MAG: hypothetical protein C5B60_02430 [Chloroflexi bacterium]|nr:MAG: hypothetical protein C5B60_02430 [Chloroflexota bacterium]